MCCIRMQLNFGSKSKPVFRYRNGVEQSRVLILDAGGRIIKADVLNSCEPPIQIGFLYMVPKVRMYERVGNEPPHAGSAQPRYAVFMQSTISGVQTRSARSLKS